MLKRQEIADPNSCWNKAADDELVFVVREHDITAADTVRDWVGRRISIGKNRWYDPEIKEALAWADKVDSRRSIKE